MRKMILAICFVCSAWSAQAAFVPGREPDWMKVASAPTKMAQRNPDPFNVAQQPAAQPQVVVPAPNVTVTNPPQTTTFLDYIWTAIAGIFTALFGVNIGMNRPKSPQDLFNNPDLHQAVEGALVQIIQSGRLAPIVQGGLGMIPGVGGVAAGLEPMIRKAVLDILQHGQAGTVTPAPTTSVNDVAGQLLDTLEKLIASKISKPAT